uniref:NADH-ubiquinone oxidoreductase chain 5 n=1 Tax=Hypochilus thorelli TaxID=139869 RepID=B2CKT8_HYPTH|nr:NADH dehydrogenase subunit 5 [Hypochilus thorelli]ACA62650.1 NADH dehydrogenase subunit 5 [Hypochilus thorelli]
MLVMSLLFLSAALILLLISMYFLFKSMMLFLSFNIMSLYSWTFNVSIMMDWMSTMFISTVMMITSAILLFSNTYISNTEKPRFLTTLLLFVISMILLIMSDNILFMLLGWDGLGLSSYVLVMIYQDQKSAKSGTITIVSNRVGDILILFSISTMFMTGDFNYWMNNFYSTLAILLIMLASFTKSAQIPFSAWLPEAMAAPTPISALVHSSTLVTAGVYILIRTFNSSDVMLFSILSSLAIITTFVSGLSANWEKDLKKIIALSTLSQIAMMMYVISLKKMNIAFFHLLTHALFKSTLFLCAGFLIFSVAYQDSRMMNLMTLSSPLLASTLGITNMALMGLPFMSGFYSKDMILESMLSSNFNFFMTLLMMTAAGLTASYSMRLIFMVTKHKNTLTELSFSNNNSMLTAILTMVSFSIFLGALLSWFLAPTPSLITPMLLKMVIPLMIMTGLLLGSMSEFKKKIYTSVGKTSLSLWLLSNISSAPFTSLTKLSTLTKNLDLSWHENLSVNYTNNVNIVFSKLTTSTLMTLMFIAMMMILTPLILL